MITGMGDRHEDGALRILLQFLRAGDALDPQTFRFGPQDYILPTAGGKSPRARFDWSPALIADLHAVRLPGRDPEVVQRVGDCLRQFVQNAGWAQYERQISEAIADDRPIFLTIRSSAAELYALPWELLTIDSGQFIGELESLLVRFEWPESKSAIERPQPQVEGGRILVAWSGAVPASAHIQAIAAACQTGFHPFNQDRDVLAHASLERLVAILTEAQQAGPFYPCPPSALSWRPSGHNVWAVSGWKRRSGGHGERGSVPGAGAFRQDGTLDCVVGL